MVGKATHKVVCAVCGRNGKVAVGKNGRIADTGWNFFGRFSVNYEAAAAVLKFETPDFSTTEAVPVEYWECEQCFQDIEKLANVSAPA